MATPLNDRQCAAAPVYGALALAAALLVATQPAAAQHPDASSLQVAAVRHLLLTADSLPDAGRPSPGALLARTGGKVSIAALGSRQIMDHLDEIRYRRRTHVIADSLRAGGLEVEVHTVENGSSYITADGIRAVACSVTVANCAWDEQADLGLVLGIREVRFLDGGANIPISVLVRAQGAEPSRAHYLLVRMEPEAGEWVVRSVHENTIFF